MFANFDLDSPLFSPTRKKENRPAELDDSTLWQRFKTGNDLAFSILYKKYVQRLFNYGMHFCYDRELVQDCLQELFGRLWDKRSQVADVQAVNSYLYKSFRRLLIDKLDRKRKQSILFLRPEVREFEILSSCEETIIREETSIQQLEQLKQAISSLTKRQREAIFLKFFNELSYKEVAVVMEMSVEAVYNLMTKSIDALRKTMRTTLLYIPLLVLPVL